MLRKTALLVLFALLHPPNLSAQDLRNRTEEMYHLGTVIISKEPLPDKVYEAQKNKFLVSVIFFEKGTNNIIISGVDTGFISDKPGVVITARHLLVEAKREVEAIKASRIIINPKFDYDYMFMGTVITRTQWLNFPLFLEAVGEVGTLKDLMALRADVLTMEKARIVGDIMNPNPLQILLKTSEFADAKLGEEVYISGLAPVVNQYYDKNNRLVTVYIDLINHTFTAELEVPITDMPGNQAGVKTLYRLRDSAEPGFSGGKVMNIKGQVVGMTIAVSFSKNFVYAISSKDIQQFMKDHKIK